MGTSHDADVRPATGGDLVAVMRLLDAAVLEADAAVVSDRIDEGAVLVADGDGRVVGALVLDADADTAHVDAVAVQTERRGRGIGSALVEAAAASVDGDLTAEFDERVRPFYESLGFDVSAADENSENSDRTRLRGRLRGSR
ncbi:Acetyltransferase (GNAT) domain-containing protein [Halogranum amylolyticum]|uniref:Acetyltransferase (GNAT) domain-containing protein n=1 Tax=Halogranum amylolyticum TaxID=660520 RepID=A0A1H8QLP6_9EURY|nr:GNAT family N-acetyltransferase [Halogranum amylolyticum]SEO54946.1 Acetyltransferase (GNAT) domain-containing protein [Halogranum amylolyticum]